MIEYVIQRDGEKKIAVGIRGDDKNEIINHYWGFWNWKATSGDDLIPATMVKSAKVFFSADEAKALG